MDNLLRIRKVIEKKVFVTKDKEKIFHKNGTETKWLFDFRRVLLKSEVLNSIAEAFWSKFSKEYPFQVGGLETASIPIITGIVLKSREKGKRDINGFFIRKSRDKDGLTRMIEGEMTNDKIILVDDLINSGSTFVRQVEAIESLGKKVSTIFVVLRFRDLEYYSYFHQKKIKIVSLFELSDFKNSLGIVNLKKKERKQTPMPFKIRWLLQIPNPNYFYVVPKSAPALDEENIYFGSDSGYFWAFNQLDGKEVWHFKILGIGSKGKTIFSSPALLKDTLYFGAYDGNFYALDKETGKKKWIFMEADWIGSSPCVAPELNMVFVGLEFGFWKKHGGIVALNATSGEKKWQHNFPGLTHGSPSYCSSRKIVVIGSNEGFVYCFKAETGKLLWSYQTGAEVKASFAFDEKRGFVCFGAHNGKFYVLDIKTGKKLHMYDTGIAIYSSPIVWQNKVFFSSLNKSVYCIDLNTFKLLWQFTTNGRVFASPVIIENKLYIGSNDARLYELDPLIGEKTGVFQSVERIVNKIAYNPKTKRFFVPTFANEIYCLERKLISLNNEK